MIHDVKRTDSRACWRPRVSRSEGARRPDHPNAAAHLRRVVGPLPCPEEPRRQCHTASDGGYPVGQQEPRDTRQWAQWRRNRAYTRPLIPLDLDGPEHARWRKKILNPLFSPGKLAPLEPQIRKVANDLLDTFFDTGSADVIEEWCVPLPSAIFLSIMGLPQDDLPSSMPSSGHNCGRIARSRGTSSLSR